MFIVDGLNFRVLTTHNGLLKEITSKFISKVLSVVYTFGVLSYFKLMDLKITINFTFCSILYRARAALAGVKSEITGYGVNQI